MMGVRHGPPRGCYTYCMSRVWYAVLCPGGKLHTHIARRGGATHAHNKLETRPSRRHTQACTVAPGLLLDPWRKHSSRMTIFVTSRVP